MSLQDLFYLLGIIMMSLASLLLLGIVILLFYIKKKITDLHDTIENKINTVSSLVSQSGEIAANVGATLAQGAIKGVARMMEKKKEK